MISKLNLNKETIGQARKSAENIAGDIHEFVKGHTTVTVERAICRLLGIDGVDQFGVPLPNVVVDSLVKKDRLSIGAAYYLGNAMAALSLSPSEIAAKVAEGLDLTGLPLAGESEIRSNINKIAEDTAARIAENRITREGFLDKYGKKSGPFLYLIVATGNIYEDIVQAGAAVRQGADIIAVIRTTGQSLLDYVPFGATVEGFGGTYATQENFRLMRAALDEAGAREGRYIMLCNYCSGLCMPEIAAMGAFERLDVMLNDALYGILFRDINMKRTLIDQFFSRVINGYAGVIINTGEDNYLTTADAVEEAHTVLDSQFINERFALISGIPEEQMGLGHAFEIDPGLENGFLFEIAQAQMAREIFPKAPLKYMPPTKHMTGNIFKAQVQDALFNITTVMTGQTIHLLGMLTEAIHTPFMSDRALSIENARYIFNTMHDIGDEITFKPDGIIQKRADAVLDDAAILLKEIEKTGLLNALEKGVFAGIKRSRDGGKGLEGVFRKDERCYFNPFIELFMQGKGLDI